MTWYQFAIVDPGVFFPVWLGTNRPFPYKSPEVQAQPKTKRTLRQQADALKTVACELEDSCHEPPHQKFQQSMHTPSQRLVFGGRAPSLIPFSTRMKCFQISRLTLAFNFADSGVVDQKQSFDAVPIRAMN